MLPLIAAILLFIPFKNNHTYIVFTIGGMSILECLNAETRGRVSGPVWLICYACRIHILSATNLLIKEMICNTQSFLLPPRRESDQ